MCRLKPHRRMTTAQFATETAQNRNFYRNMSPDSTISGYLFGSGPLEMLANVALMQLSS